MKPKTFTIKVKSDASEVDLEVIPFKEFEAWKEEFKRNIDAEISYIQYRYPNRSDEIKGLTKSKELIDNETKHEMQNMR